jgi:hypothetical protein
MARGADKAQRAACAERANIRDDFAIGVWTPELSDQMIPAPFD